MSNAKVNKQERRDAAREQARKLREAQQRREKRNRLLIIAGVVVFIAIVAAALFSIISSANRAPLEGVDERPAGATENGAIQVGADGVGSENEGAPVVDLYLDYLCTYCAQFEALNAGVLEELAANGEATVNYHPITYITASDFNMRASNAAAVVATESPEHFTEFNEQLFAAQGEGGATPLSDDQVADIAREIGIPDDVIESFGDGQYTEWVEGITEQARRDDIGGTPTVLIDGEEFTGWQQEGALAQAVADAAA
ncbi:DsbA family protein [Georgenia sp. H159]|uniref:DsbA family protein n=1 Tax=Georgenia sp. H159 TaxID=3076115 RepID=UPI002D772E00|nr:thioredoxin domain-containing protein [Georgenia sp. H159]